MAGRLDQWEEFLDLWEEGGNSRRKSGPVVGRRYQREDGRTNVRNVRPMG
jgi:hypothetical protein